MRTPAHRQLGRRVVPLLGGLAWAAALVACGGGAKGSRSGAPGLEAPLELAHEPEVPARAATGAEALLALLPEGADAVCELDLARVRDNGVLGPVLEKVPPREVLGFDPARDLDTVAVAVYDLAGDQAATLFVLRGAGLRGKPVPGAARVDEETVLVGPEALRGRKAGAPPAAFLALRASAMPSRATAAVVRLTARLTPAARIAAAGRLGVDEVPATISLWGDVVDDAALVALLGGDDRADAERLAEGVKVLEQRLGAWLPRGVLDKLTVEVREDVARAVWVIPPRRLEIWARDLARRLEGGGRS